MCEFLVERMGLCGVGFGEKRVRIYRSYSGKRHFSDDRRIFSDDRRTFSDDRRTFSDDRIGLGVTEGHFDYGLCTGIGDFGRSNFFN